MLTTTSRTVFSVNFVCERTIPQPKINSLSSPLRLWLAAQTICPLSVSSILMDKPIMGISRSPLLMKPYSLTLPIRIKSAKAEP